MSRRWVPVVAAVLASLSFVACGGGGDAAKPAAGSPSSVVTASTTPASTTSTTKSPIEGVQLYPVVAGHSEAPVNYPQVPPVGGTHNPIWQPCTFYDQPVEAEKAVHSLEHGAIWITYGRDLPPAELAALATFARSRKDIVASRFDDGLPSPIVATTWGRQLVLQSFNDPRLIQFVNLYTNKGPEPNAPC